MSMRYSAILIFVALCNVLHPMGARIKRKAQHLQHLQSKAKSRDASNYTQQDTVLASQDGKDPVPPTVWLAVSNMADGVQEPGITMCEDKEMTICKGDLLPWGRSIEGEVHDGMLRHGGVWLPMGNLQQVAGQRWEHIVNGKIVPKIFKAPNLKVGSATSESIKPGQKFIVVGEKEGNGVRFLKIGENRWVPQHKSEKEGGDPLFRRLDILPHTIINNNRKHYTVVGCGIAGIVTALELAQRPEVGKITILEREAACALGTSGRIAAELMFYNFERDFFNDGSYKWKMLKQKILAAQGSAHQGAWPRMLEMYKRHKAVKGTRIKVNCDKACAQSLRFMWSPHGAPAIESKGNASKVQNLRAGDVLIKVKGKNPHQVFMTVQGWEKEEEALRHNQVNSEVHFSLLEGLKGSKINGKAFELEFQRGGDPRVTEPYMAAFFAKAANRMKELIHAYPALCETIITPFCCDREFEQKHPGFMQQHAEAWGYNCHNHLAPTGMGMAEVFMTTDTYNNAKDKGWVDNPTSFEVWSAAEVSQYLPTYIDNDQQYGAAVNRDRSGFVRTEDLGRVFKGIMDGLGHEILTGYELSGTIMNDNGQIIVEHIEVQHDWQEVVETVQKGGQQKRQKHYRLMNVNYGVKSWFPSHGVVICTGATIKAVAKMDQDVSTELIPGFGNIVVGPPDKVPMEERRMGVVLEEYHMYLRSTKGGNLAVGGGLWCSFGNDDMVRALPYKDAYDIHGEIWGTTGDKYMSQSSLGRWLIDQEQTVRKGGARPLSYFGNFPLIKLHPWAPVVLNTGGGVNGFSISWGSGEIAADLLMYGRPIERNDAGMWQKSWNHMNAVGSTYVKFTEAEVIAEDGVKIFKAKKVDKNIVEVVAKGDIINGFVAAGSDDGWFTAKSNSGDTGYIWMMDKNRAPALRFLA